MAFWWASQGKTFAHESKAGYFFAPGPHSANSYHWRTLDRAAIGDLVFSYVAGKILATATVTATVVPAPPPSCNPSKNIGLGRLVAARYELIQHLSIHTLPLEVLKALACHHGPLNRLHTGNQGYFFEVNEAAAQDIITRIGNAQ